MKIITLCGSTKFKEQFEQTNAFLTLQGNIVISLAFFEQSEGFEITEKQAYSLKYCSTKNSINGLGFSFTN